MADLERPMADVVPEGCTWIRDSVEAVDPAAPSVRTRGGSDAVVHTLVLCPGLVEDWDATPGLQAAYADGWAASHYVPGQHPDGLAEADVAAQRSGRLHRAAGAGVVRSDGAQAAVHGVRPLAARRRPARPRRPAGPARCRRRRVCREADEVLERAFADYGIEVLREARIERVDWDAHSLTLASPPGGRCSRTSPSRTPCRTTGHPGGSPTPAWPPTRRRAWSTSTRTPCGPAGTSRSGRSATPPTSPRGPRVERCGSRSTS